MLIRFRSFFFATLALGIILLFVPLIVVTRVHSAQLPAKPPFPIPGKAFVAEYSGVGADAAHLIYYWDLFGIDNQVRKAKVLLLGSSHMQFGLSAGEMSGGLSTEAKQRVPVFNLGLGCAETLTFDSDLLARLGIKKKTLIADADVYLADHLTACSIETENSDRFQALFKVSAIWFKFAFDWVLDGQLPLVTYEDQAISGTRFLAPVVILDWRTGDCDFYYRPESGEMFPSSANLTTAPVMTGRPGELPWSLSTSTIAIPPQLRNVVASESLRTIFTLVPYATSPYRSRRISDIQLYETIERLTNSRASNDAPFIPISGRGLATFDYGHLTGESRQIATDRLTSSIMSAGLLQSIVGMAPETRNSNGTNVHK
jgi:hypothetical protein